MAEGKSTCTWAKSDPLMLEYHDREWGTPVYDDRKLFEYITLDAFQAGLSWMTILRKRDNFRKALSNFDPMKIARYRKAKIQRLLEDPGIIRNRQKIESAVTNAQAFLKIVEEYGSFSEFLWGIIDGKPIVHKFRTLKQIPTETKESQKMSKVLRECGFKFVGPTICYAFMQAAGLVNDHFVDCYRHLEVQHYYR